MDCKDVNGIHGLDDEHEDILVRAVDFDEVYKMLADQKIESAIPIIAIQWLALNKQQLKQKWGA